MRAHRLTRGLLLLALCGCGQIGAPPAPAPQPGSPAPAVAAPTGAAPVAGAPTLLQLGTGPQPVTVAAAPNFTLNLTQPGEYLIDAMGSPLDAQLALYQGDQLVASDSDSGEGSDAQILRFLQPGAYTVRVTEYRGMGMSGRVQAQLLAPLTPAGAMAPGAPPLAVQVPAGPNQHAACREVTLNVAQAGSYQIDATSDESHDAQLVLIQNNAIVAEDSDSGGNHNARITRDLAPGVYTVRVYDWLLRDAPITVTVAARP